MDQFGVDLDGKLEAMKRLTVTQADHEAVEKEVVDLRTKVETKDNASLDLQVIHHYCCIDSFIVLSTMAIA